ncbi:hypothetical protein [Candidatus Amarolinea aalborgensis]|jgi:hypothetical protein|uniref:hypothetical protein n=1 Tax=Candidatus Amarolinea aalborgensis TaxID=2249329 RepID=UPI003BF9B226
MNKRTASGGTVARMASKHLFIVGLALLLFASCGCTLPISIARLRKPDLSKYTTPLDSDTIQDICTAFELRDNRLCTQDGPVYAPDFFPIILSTFERGVSTRDDVKAKLGRYEYGCELPTYVPSLELTYYVCSYDLNGDRVFPVVIFYLDNDIVWRMTGTIGDD